MNEETDRLLRVRIPVSQAFNFVLYDGLGRKFDKEFNRIVRYRFIKRKGHIDIPRVQSEGERLESKALEVFGHHNRNFNIKTAHTFVNPNFPFMMSQVDGIMFNKDGYPYAIIEVKSPKKLQSIDIETYLNPKELPFSISYNKTNQSYYVNPNSNVYTQIQLNMCILNISLTYVIFFSGLNNSYISIPVHINNRFVSFTLRRIEFIYKTRILPVIYEKCNK